MIRFDTPVAAFQAAVDAYVARDVERFGECFDASSLARTRRETIESLRQPRRVITADEIMRDEPKMPRKAAEHLAAQITAHSASLLAHWFPDARSIEDVEAMSPGAFFFAQCEARSPKRHFAQLVAEGRISAKYAATPFPEPRIKTLGWIADGEFVAHVLYREEVAGEFVPGELLDHFPEAERPMVLELARREHARTQHCWCQSDGGWKVVADHFMLGHGALGFASVGPSEPET